MNKLTVFSLVILVGCASMDKPLVEATTYSNSNSFDHIENIERDLAGPGFEMPVMIGGMDEFGRQLRQLSRDNPCPVRGRVSVAYVVGEDGTVLDAKIALGIHEQCDRLVEAAIKKVKFEPARKNGKPIRIVLATPATFN